MCITSMGLEMNDGVKNMKLYMFRIIMKTSYENTNLVLEQYIQLSKSRQFHLF